MKINVYKLNLGEKLIYS